MSKKYYLYLDESGDFDKDLLESWKNECLVGGLLMEGETISDNEAKSILVRCWKKVFPTNSRLSENTILKNIRHSTELEEHKAETVCEILQRTEQYGEFIIFENFNKTRIINSTVTYVNIMADGIVQLLSRLVLENPNEKIQLYVIAGFRKDTTVCVTKDSVSGYIDKNECVNRIRERIALLTVKNNNILAHNSTVFFEYKDDKRTMQLILADYICNFYYTNTAKIYRAKYIDGITYQQYLMEKFYEKNIFSLNGDSERERIMSYLNIQDYGTALYEVSADIIKKTENRMLIIEAFVQLTDLVQMNHLRSLDNYINNIVAVERQLSDFTLTIIDNTINLLSQIRANNGIDVSPNIFSMLLYKLAIYNHRGDLEHMEQLFEECKNMLGNIAFRIEYLNYVFMFYNRYAVYLIDNFNVEEAFDLLEHVKEAFEGLELAVSAFPYQSSNGEFISSEQLGKILGTQAQCCRYMMVMDRIEYEKAVSISNEAIRNFSAESDKRRQYQYRAQIEIEAGHYEEALVWLMRGCGYTSIKDFFEAKGVFELYHLSAFVRKFAGDECHEEEINDILNRFDKISKNFNSEDFPSFLTLGNIAEAMAKSNKEKGKVQAYYKKSFVINDDMETLFKILKLCIWAGYESWLISINDVAVYEQIKLMQSYCDKFLQEAGELPRSLIEMVKKLEFILRAIPDKEAFYQYSRLRQY